MNTTRNLPVVLLVDDEPDFLRLVERWLAQEDLKVLTAPDGKAALQRMELVKPDLVITDLVMDGIDGLRLLSDIHRLHATVPVIMLSGKGTVTSALQAAHLGVSAFLTKPTNKETLVGEIHRHLSLAGRRGSPGEEKVWNQFVYRSTAMGNVVRQVSLVADSDSSVLLTGATGTGKEVIAGAIHASSPRREGPFVSLNCSAMPEQLLESELFGHVKGAFSGAVRNHEGLFRAAHGGTLFLDEIGDMPLPLQAKLLRVLQDFKVRPVGATQDYDVDVRIISATHRDLDKMVEEGEFREDLYYRLCVVPLTLPLLRERRDDIPLLVDRFLGELAARSGKETKHFAPEAMNLLVGAKWPGNIRQLRNVVENCFVLCTSKIIDKSLVERALRESPRDIPTLEEARQAFERRYLVSILHTTNGNVANAARLAGRNRTEFYRLLERYELVATEFRRATEKGG